jgi:4-coumarate--CoA ligase
MPLRISAPAIARVLRALIAAELAAHAGRAIPVGESIAWPDDLSFGPEGLALDSLELLAVAGAVNQFFQLHESGIEDYLLSRRRLDHWVEIVAAGLADGTTGITFMTSGSTGRPKPCPQPHAALAEEVRFWAARFADTGRIVQLVPAHHIYGFLFTVLLPDALGRPVLDARAMAPGRLAREIAAADLLIGFPAGLARLLREVPALPEGLRCLSSTAPLPAAQHAALRAAGIAEVIEIYGSSETGGIGWRTDPAASFRLLPRWRPGAAEAAASVLEQPGDAEVPLPDRAEWLADGRLRLLGRKDRAVQVGGVNVHPAQVAAALARHPSVAQCAVRLDDSLAEPRLKALVVPAPGLDPGLAPAAVTAALMAWCRDNFAAAERPVRIDLADRLPSSGLDKPADWPAAA